MKRAGIIIGVVAAALAAASCGQMTGFESDNKFEGVISGAKDGVDGKRNIRGPAIFLYAEDKEYAALTTFDYGTISIDEIPGEKTVVFAIKNEGENTLTLTGSPVVALTGDAAFSIVAQPAFVGGNPQIETGKSVTFSVKFKPAASDSARYGLKTSELAIKSDDKDLPELKITLQATGTNGSWQALWGTLKNEKLTRGASNSNGKIFVTGYIGPEREDESTVEDDYDLRDAYIAELDPRTGLVAGKPEKEFEISDRGDFNMTAIDGISALTMGDYVIGGLTAYKDKDKDNGYTWNGYALAKISDLNREPYPYYFYTDPGKFENKIPAWDDFTNYMMFYPPLDYYDAETKPLWADSYLTNVLYDNIWGQIYAVGTARLFRNPDDDDDDFYEGLFINGHYTPDLSLFNDSGNSIFIPFTTWETWEEDEEVDWDWDERLPDKFVSDFTDRYIIDTLLEVEDEDGNKHVPADFTYSPYQIKGAATFDNGVIVVGSVITNEGQKAVAIYVKMNPSINWWDFGWARVYGDVNSSFHNAVKVGNDVLLLGYTNGDGHATGEGYVVKLSPGGDGTPVFEKSTATFAFEQPNATVGLGLSNLTEFFNGVQDSDGHYVLVGQSNSAASGPVQNAARTHGVANAAGAHGMEDGYLVKLNATNGDVLSDPTTGVPYQRWFGGAAMDQFEGICETSTYYYLIGYSKSNFASYNNQGDFDNWVLRIPKDTLELQE